MNADTLQMAKRGINGKAEPVPMELSIAANGVFESQTHMGVIKRKVE